MRIIRILTVFTTLALTFLITTAGQSLAAPLTISHQGLITDNGGVPLTGAYSLSFSLYSAPAGGAPMWTEVQVVNATNGLFAVTLGNTAALSSALFSGATPATHLGVTVGGDPELTPRVELGSSPYSLNSASVDGFSSGPGNVNLGQLSIVGGDDNTNHSDFSSILGGSGNSIDITEFIDTIFNFDSSGFTPLRRSQIPLHGAGTGTILGGHDDTVCGNHSVIVQGWQNVNCAPYSFLGTGFANKIYSSYSTLGSGWNNIMSAPASYSVLAGGALNRSNAAFTVISGGVFNNAGSFTSVIAGGVFNNTLGNFRGQVIGGGWSNATNNHFSTIGGGQDNRALADFSTVGGGFNDSASASFATVSGGSNNTAISIMTTVGGGDGNRAEGQASTVAGGEGNQTVQQTHQFIGGGQDNRATGQYSTIGGGQNNGTFATSATVAGGAVNHANSDYSAIGGGFDNLATAISSTVGGGVGNVASGPSSFVGGGDGNVAGPGSYATVAGGFRNIASGAHSFAAGTNAHAPDSCSFIWADCCPIGGTTSAMPYTTSIENSFNARATNGFYFLTTCDSVFDPAAGVGAGVYVEPGGSMWMTGSSRTLKKNISQVDGSDILAKIEQMPIYRWSYKTQDDNVEHIGPMAEEFFETFKLGSDEKAIGAMDPAGISLAATKELIKENKELKARLDRLEKLVSNLLDQD